MLQTMVKIIIITVIIQPERSRRKGRGCTVDRAAAMCVCVTVWWAWHSRPAVTRCQHLEGILQKHKKEA